MAKQGKAQDSILLRSAESLGRVIGTLQRQLDGATKQVAEAADDVIARLPFGHDGDGARRTAKPSARKRAATKRTANGKGDGAAQVAKHAATRRRSNPAPSGATRKTSRTRKTTNRA
jgi:hypothetical protein